MPHSFRPHTRELWSFVGTTLTIVSGWIGIGEVLGGAKVVHSPDRYLLEHVLPGGVRTHGVVLLLLAIGMARTVLTRFDRQSTWLLRCFAGYTFLVGASFVGSWFITHNVVWAGPVVWLGMGALAEGLVIFPPSVMIIKQEGTVHALSDSPPSRGRAPRNIPPGISRARLRHEQPEDSAGLRDSRSGRRDYPRSPLLP